MTALALALVDRAPRLAPFCASCGGRLPLLRPEAVGCPHCGEELVRVDGTLASSSPIRPWLAAAASLLLPGAGQAWNGEWRKALLVLLTFWLIVPWIWGVVDAWRTARRQSLAPVRAIA